MPDTAAGLPIAPLPSATPVGYGYGSFRLCPVTRRLSGCGPCHPQSCRIRLRALPIAPLPSATPASCGPFRLSPLPLLAVEGRRGRERGTTVCFTRDRLRRAAAVGSVWRKGGMTGGRRLPGLQGKAGRMAGGVCRVCKGESGSGGPSDPLEDHWAAPCDGPQLAWRAPGRRIFRHAVRR